jgi:histone H3/H4
MIKRPFEDSQLISSSYHSPTKTVITEDLLEQAAHSVNQSVILEEDVKQGIIMYMEEFVDKLVAETGRATNLRKSKLIQAKDVDYALRFNVNAATNSTSGSVRFNK